MHSNEVVDLQKFRSSETDTVPADDAVSQYLPAGTTLLVGQYIIDGYLNCGGFGITYTARDSLGRKVAIKECFPGEMVYRDGKAMKSRSPKYRKELSSIVRNFVTEAHSLANVKHPNIVHVHQIFEENGTAYLAMDFVDGPDLLDVLESDHTLSPLEVERITRNVLGAIRYLHRIGMLHRDISPDNILVQRDGSPVLIDFGAARHFSPDETEVVPAMKFVKDGYSPQEFYVAGSAQGPSSDLYAFAATIYHVITGAAPADAQSRLAARAAKKPDPYKPLANTVPDYSPRFVKALDKALSLLPEERLQSVEDWLDRIGPEPNAPPNGLFAPVTAVLESLSVFEDAKGSETGTAPLVRRPRIAAGVAAAALLLGGALLFSQVRGVSDTTTAVLPPSEPTPPELQRLTALSEPAPLASVWPDGFAALRRAPAVDVEIAIGQNYIGPAAGPETLAAGGVPRIPPVDAGQVRSGFTTPAPVEPIATLPQPNVTIALDLPTLVPTPGWSNAVRPPQKSPLTGLDSAHVNQLGASPLNVTLQSIAPVALIDRAVPLPVAPQEPLLSLDTTAPEIAPSKITRKPQSSFSAWDIELPFISRPPRVGEETALVITSINRDEDRLRFGDWITEGLILVGLNGAPLRDGVPLKQQILDTLTIGPDGTAQVSVFYRAPRADVLDTGTLTLPIIRRTGLADGTLLETQKQGALWITSVAALGNAETDLQVGDIIIANASNPTRLTDHNAVEASFNALVLGDLTAANFSVLRQGQRQFATWRFDPAAPRNAELSPSVPYE